MTTTKFIVDSKSRRLIGSLQSKIRVSDQVYHVICEGYI